MLSVNVIIDEYLSEWKGQQATFSGLSTLVYIHVIHTGFTSEYGKKQNTKEPSLLKQKIISF